MSISSKISKISTALAASVISFCVLSSNVNFQRDTFSVSVRSQEAKAAWWDFAKPVVSKGVGWSIKTAKGTLWSVTVKAIMTPFPLAQFAPLKRYNSWDNVDYMKRDCAEISKKWGPVLLLNDGKNYTCYSQFNYFIKELIQSDLLERFFF